MESIAVVGLGCLFPGSQTPDQYWNHLMAKDDCTSELSKQEVGVDPKIYWGPKAGTIDKIHYHRNGHIRDFQFDASNYEIPEEELNKLGPLFQWTLYVARQALLDAHSLKLEKSKLKKTGIIVGNIGMPTLSCKHLAGGFYQRALEPYIRKLIGCSDFKFCEHWNAEDLSELNLMTGSYNAIVAAQAFGLGGPCFAIDAACASALYAVHLACNYLQTRTVDLMLAGSVCHADHIYINHGFNILQAFPESGESIPLDQRSKGLKAGEGAGMLVLKRLSDAERDGDVIHAVIEAIGLANDAGAKHILVPDMSGQVLALSRAYENFDASIDYLECHATGTPVGDEAELNAIEAFFSKKNMGNLPLIGANKGNVGHMLTASGMASILKVILAMRHGVIPPTLGIDSLVRTKMNALRIDHVVQHARPWHGSQNKDGSTRARHAGINAFGFGGVNAHMILSDYQATASRISTDIYEKKQYKEPNDASFNPAIVGIGVHLEGINGVNDFEAAIRENKCLLRKLPRTRWLGLERHEEILKEKGIQQPPLGAYIEHLSFDCKRFKLPPKMVGSHLISHASLLPVAEQAFIDAGYEITGEKRNIAVIVAGDVDLSCLRYQARNEASWQLNDGLKKCGIDLTNVQIEMLESAVKDALFPAPYPEGITGGIGNIVASRIAAHLKLDGPAFALCSHENAVFKAIEVAQIMLSQKFVEAVLVASGSCAGGIENILWGGRRLADSPVGEGAGAILIQDIKDVRNNIYAKLSGLKIYQQLTSSSQYKSNPEGVHHAVDMALKHAAVSSNEIDYIELCRGALREDQKSESEGLSAIYGHAVNRGQDLFFGSLINNVGHTGPLQGLLGIIKVACCLCKKYIPAGAAMFDDLGGNQSEANRNRTAPQAWIKANGMPRRAAVNSLGMDFAYAHLILEEPNDACAKNFLNSKNSLDNEFDVNQRLIKKIYTGNDRTMHEIILDGHHINAFANVKRSFSREGEANRYVRAEMQSDLCTRQYLRNINTHLHFLKTQSAICVQVQKLVADLNSKRYSTFDEISPKNHDMSSSQERRIILNEEQLREITDGSVASVLGADYAQVDEYSIRTRMPSAPFMFVSRITAISAQRGKLEPCFIEWEYDIDPNAWFVVDKSIASFVALESSHAMIVAFTIIGCDQLFKGQLRYRALDSKTKIISEMPKAGEVLRGRVNIKSFVRVGKNVLIAYEYLCYVGQRLCFKLEANSGFFSPQDLERAKGINASDYFKLHAHNLEAIDRVKQCLPFIHSEKNKFDTTELLALQEGRLDICFGESYSPQGISSNNYGAVKLYAPMARMLDRVTSISCHGGAFGLGEATGEVDIKPDHWAFKAHFKNDPVMPGTLVIEGCEQLLKFFLAYIGLYSQNILRPYVLLNHTSSAKFRGEVKHQIDTLTYKLTCKSIRTTFCPEGDYLSDIQLIFIAEIILKGEVIGICDQLGAGFCVGSSPTDLSIPPIKAMPGEIFDQVISGV